MAHYLHWVKSMNARWGVMAFGLFLSACLGGGPHVTVDSGDEEGEAEPAEAPSSQNFNLGNGIYQFATSDKYQAVISMNINIYEQGNLEGDRFVMHDPMMSIMGEMIEGVESEN